MKILVPPKEWKGACRGGSDFSCNKWVFFSVLLEQKFNIVVCKCLTLKDTHYSMIVGAQIFYSLDSINQTARDTMEHGKHAVSTAAGIKNASFYVLAQWTARGGVPSARIAVCEVCSNFQLHGSWYTGCLWWIYFNWLNMALQAFI